MAVCRLCERLRDPSVIPGGAIYEDDLLHASHWYGDGPGYLGEILIQTKRHTPGVADLTDEEARDVGLQSTRIARALKEVVGAEKIYTYVFGEAVPHFHELVVARPHDVPERYWRLNLSDWPEAPQGDAEAVAELAVRLRARLGPSTE
jgi:diadenosine tetraphosphate (Ap4A) HIT family hydrolase